MLSAPGRGPSFARRSLRYVAVACALVVLAGCEDLTSLSAPASTESITLVSSSTQSGWRYDYYRNSAYPCSVSGYQTFVVGTKVGSSSTATAPLWVFMHGGGGGYFDQAGNPVPSQAHKVEESAATLISFLANNQLVARIRNDVSAFRLLAVSYCSHDGYAGTDTFDPYNPNTVPGGGTRPTNGLRATKAAVAFTRGALPTSDVFLHGTSAGSVGSIPVAWAMQLEGFPPAGVVADASVPNQAAIAAAFAAGVCTSFNDPAVQAALYARVNNALAADINEPDYLLLYGRLRVPVLHLWNHGDTNTCGSIPIPCPLRDGSTPTIGVTDCIHEPLRIAIDALGPSSRSVNFPVCVDTDGTPDCSRHVVTNAVGATNTDPSTPADYLTGITDWVHARLLDP